MFLHDAQERTESWKKRHSPGAVKQLGVWRWKGIQDNAELIFNEINEKFVIDFGGRDAPLGYGSVIIDRGESIADCVRREGNTANVIFSSHTIEHIMDIPSILKEMHDSLEPIEGRLILHLPSYTCERWRAGEYRNEKQTDHLHTFCLSQDKETGFECIDKIVCATGFNIEKAEYVGDDSILIIARRKT